MKSNQKPVLLLGLGGHAKVLINILRLNGCEIKGALSCDPVGTEVMGVKVLGSDDALLSFNPSDIELVNALGHLPKNRSRENLFRRSKKHGFKFAQVIHPSAIIANCVKLEEGVQLMAGVIVEPSVTIGSNTIINTGVNINHDTTIGSNAHIAPGVVICGGVDIGSSAFVGAGSSVMPGTKVQDGTFIKAGRVVKDELMIG